MSHGMHRHRVILTAFTAMLFASSALLAEAMKHSETWRMNEKWNVYGDLKAKGKHFAALMPGEAIVANVDKSGKYQHAWHLFSKEAYRDVHLSMEFMLPENSNSGVYFMGRYEIQLRDSYGKMKLDFGDLGGLYQRWDNHKNPKGYEGVAPGVNAAKAPGEWQQLEVIFRGPRFQQDGSKTHHAKFLKVIVNGQLVLENQVAKGPTRSARHHNESASAAPLMIQGDHGPIAIRKVALKHLDLTCNDEAALIGDEATPLDTHGRPSVNAVSLGKELFKSKGCAECHGTEPGLLKTGPSLHGLFTKDGRETKVYIPSEGHHKSIPADFAYFKSSLRRASEELAYQADGTPHLPIMPRYGFKQINDDEAHALISYLKTLNHEAQSGPSNVWIETPPKKYVLAKDPIAVWVKDSPRLERVDCGETLSARAYHVGLPGDINYSFDPRTMSIAQVWDGPFLRKHDQVARGLGAAERGYQSREYQIGHLFQPLDRHGNPIDLTFSSPAKIKDPKQSQQFLADKRDVLETIEEFPARFVGLVTPRHKNPGFLYRVLENAFQLDFIITPERQVIAHFDFDFKEPQVLQVPSNKLKHTTVSLGEIQGSQWRIPAGTHTQVEFRAMLPEIPGELYSSDLSSIKVSDAPQKLTWSPNTKNATLPAGYRLEVANTPKDRFDRNLVFEPMAIEFHRDECFISTRTAGIWKVVDGHWHHFADACYDSLGMVVNASNDVVIGEKPGLTRLIDADGDHWAERRENLNDQFRFNGDYHEYLHGPIKRNGHYLFALNLINEVKGMHKAGGAWMGTVGGLRGWMLSSSETGETSIFASGFRSPAGLALSPNNEIIYTENQGEYVGTSKVFTVKEDGFYGNPTGLIDQKGMNTDSPEVQWDTVKSQRELPIALLPHNEVMNAPGSPEFITESINFGPCQGQMLIGDQLQSNIYRLDVEVVNGQQQAVALPFMQGLDSGAMRLRFDPNDSSLWIGQTGRGWRAKGGKEFALQRIVFDPTASVDTIQTVKVTPRGFDIHFTQAQPETQGSPPVLCHSWFYMNNAKYGSPKYGERSEKITEATWSDDQKTLSIQIANFKTEHRDKPEQSTRVYRIDLSQSAFGKKHGAFLSKAYYTLYQVPVEPEN